MKSIARYALGVLALRREDSLDAVERGVLQVRMERIFARFLQLGRVPLRGDKWRE